MFNTVTYICALVCFYQFHIANAWFNEKITLREDIVTPGNIIALSGDNDVTGDYFLGNPVPRGTRVIISAKMMSNDNLNTTYGTVEAVCTLTSFNVPGQPGICGFVFNFVNEVPSFGKGTISGYGFFPGLAAFPLGAEEDYVITGGTGDFEAKNPIRERVYGAVTRRTPDVADTPTGPSYHTWTFRK